MSKPKEHLDKIDEELDIMGEDGHFDEFEANTRASAVRYELSKLREALDRSNSNTIL